MDPLLLARIAPLLVAVSDWLTCDCGDDCQSPAATDDSSSPRFASFAPPPPAQLNSTPLASDATPEGMAKGGLTGALRSVQITDALALSRPSRTVDAQQNSEICTAVVAQQRTKEGDARPGLAV